MVKCTTCERSAKIKTAKTGQLQCVECFLPWFEKDVHETIQQLKLFTPGESIAVGRYSYGLNLILLCIDEGIRGYRDDSIREVKKNEADLGLDLTIVSYKQLYGWTMDDIVSKIGKKNNCTFCGVFRRQALDRGALKVELANWSLDTMLTI
uniref:Cytoplasmic tRNA 2-thiolation protein 1 n=1 Tax=Ditylenchus dipsaci TaxID=166011 RepID=A0A915D202_9BILA